MERVVLIPAAGTGSRLGAGRPKALVPVNGRPMIVHLLELYAPHAEHAVAVVSPAARDEVARATQGAALPVDIAIQEQPTGMLDAIMRGREAIERLRPRRVLVTWCDQVAIAPETAQRVDAAARSIPEPALVLPTCVKPEPYVHLDRDASGRIVAVRHRREGDRMPDTGEGDAGAFDLSLEAFLDLLPEYARAPEIGARTGERNFVPFVAWVSSRAPVVTVPCTEPEETIGINTPDELALVEAHLRARARR